MRHVLAFTVCVFLLASCGSDPPRTAPPGLRTLISADWTLAGGGEIYHCARVTLAEDVWIHEFRPRIPLGTHHTVVSLDDSGQKPDGSGPCTDPFEGGAVMIYGTGVGSRSEALPPGTAVKIPAGAQVVLNLHLFNTNGSPISGTSAVDVVAVAPEDVEHQARADLAGPFALAITEAQATFSSTCTVAAELTAFAVQPHMHKLGRHMRATLTPAGGGAPVTLLDTDYDFDQQVHSPLTPMLVFHPGDQLFVECTFEPVPGRTVEWGESTTDEMCFLGVMYWPASQPLCKY